MTDKKSHSTPLPTHSGPGESAAFAPSPASSPVLDRDDTLAEAGRKILYYHIQAIKSSAHSASGGSSAEGVHKMRVATRRFRSVFLVFRKALPRQYRSVILKPMKRTAKTLGNVRDIDVQLLHLHSYIASFPGAAEGLAPLARHLEKRRKQAQRALTAWMNSQGYARFLGKAFELLSDPLTIESLPGRHALRSVSDAIPQIIYKQISELAEIDYDAEEFGKESFHQLRIRGKRLRYTLESFQSLLGPGAKGMLRALRAMQDALGEMNDAYCMLDIMDTLEKEQPYNTDTWRLYRSSLKQHITSAAEIFPGLYKELFSNRNKKALAKSIGGL